MIPDRIQRAYEVFEQALEHLPEERAAFLAEMCADDAQLRAEVVSLLDHDSRVPADFMQPPQPGSGLAQPSCGERFEPLIGTRVGRFLIREVVGSGGMGTVYAAEQDQLHRTVALKIIKLGMDTQQVVARFESEREALAMMNHPNIAKVLDAGATEQGRPYFAMEYVSGVPITEHCDHHRLDIAARLRLFIQVCDAVQHAHQKGIIHRDLKPSNILVEEISGRATPKIIDFGVAKAIGQRLSERTVFTEQGQVVGTLEYMCPEQAELSGQDIDTRADVYSLGVLLYELLTGALPFDSKTLRQAAYAEIQRIIREVEPEKPSTRVSHLGTSATDIPRPSDGEGAAAPTTRTRQSALDEVTRNRHSDVRTLMRELRSDLDWIVMKCLEKDRSRRYETASALAADVQRHLNHEPVVAGPPSAVYRVRKFIRRHRGTVLAATLVMLTLVAGLIGTAIFAMREAEQRKLAEENAQRAKESEVLALKRADETKQVAEFHALMLSGINAEKMGQTIVQELRKQVQTGLERTSLDGEESRVLQRTAEEIDALLTQFDIAVRPANPTDVARQIMDITVLAPAVAALKERFKGQPQVQAELLNTLGTVYASIGQYDLAESQLRRALELWRGPDGDETATVATGLSNLAGVLYDKGDYTAAEQLYREALGLRRKLFGREHPDVATSFHTLAWLLYVKGDYAGAEPLYREALTLRRKLFGSEHPDVATSMNNLALLLKAKGDDTAEALFREALAMRRRLLGDGHPRVAESLSNLAGLLKAKGDYAAAEQLYREALTVDRKALGDDHPMVALILNNLASVLHEEGNYATAEVLYREALAVDRKALGDEHPAVAGDLNNLAMVLRARGDYAAAEPLQREALALYRKMLGSEHPNVAMTLNNLAALLKAKGDDAEAEPLYREALAIREKKLSPAHLDTADTRVGLGTVLTQRGRYAEAEALLAAAWETYAQAATVPARSMRRALSAFVELYDAWHKAEPEKGYDAKAAEWRARQTQHDDTTQTRWPAQNP